jgi:arsenate reductase (thioredoxin)
VPYLGNRYVFTFDVMKKKILVLCTANSCRSQIAHGYLTKFAGDKFEVYSAGVEADGVNPRAIKTMKEDGVDISHHTSNHANEYSNIQFDYVLTVCDNAQEKCPYFPAKLKSFHHDFPDPAKATGTEQQIMSSFRTTREMIKKYVENLIKNEF